jgi:hypothetical protein
MGLNTPMRQTLPGKEASNTAGNERLADGRIGTGDKYAEFFE